MFMRMLAREGANQWPTATVGYAGTILSLVTSEGFRTWVSWGLGCILTLAMIASAVTGAWRNWKRAKEKSER
jgi:hypothetical protein